MMRWSACSPVEPSVRIADLNCHGCTKTNAPLGSCQLWPSATRAMRHCRNGMPSQNASRSRFRLRPSQRSEHHLAIGMSPNSSSVLSDMDPPIAGPRGRTTGGENEYFLGSIFNASVQSPHPPIPSMQSLACSH